MNSGNCINLGFSLWVLHYRWTRSLDSLLVCNRSSNAVCALASTGYPTTGPTHPKTAPYCRGWFSVSASISASATCLVGLTYLLGLPPRTTVLQHSHAATQDQPTRQPVASSSQSHVGPPDHSRCNHRLAKDGIGATEDPEVQSTTQPRNTWIPSEDAFSENTLWPSVREQLENTKPQQLFDLQLKTRSKTGSPMCWCNVVLPRVITQHLISIVEASPVAFRESCKARISKEDLAMDQDEQRVTASWRAWQQLEAERDRLFRAMVLFVQ
ncbi:MAG: hypothetical protein J3Q66DRAFT_367242 [Benniella sp.]|nr:MAG: hypothetical protein J3Q66DRAFT_367242 [Benniella sp.]